MDIIRQLKRLVKKEAEWADVEVVLASFPKCGRTWFRFQIANYLNIAFDAGVDLDLNNMFTFIPEGLSHNTVNGLSVSAFRNHPDIPFISATHQMPSELNMDGKKVIFLIRDPKDIFLSAKFDPSVDKRSPVFINTLRTHPRKGIIRYCMYMNAWADLLNHTDHVMLSYESMKRDTEAELGRALRFIDVPVNTDWIRQAVSLAGMENMRRLEQERGIGYVRNPGKNDNPRVNKGVVGRGKEELSPETQAFIDQCLDISLTDEAKRLLKACDVL